MRINVDDFRPVTSARYHLPPSAHTTFVADGFVVCTFAPRPLEEDPDALRLPFFHRNIDYDEVILYHRGEFFSAGRASTRGCSPGTPSGCTTARSRAPARATPRRPPRPTGRAAHGRRGRGDDRRPPRRSCPGEAAKDLDVEGYVRSWSPDA